MATEGAGQAVFGARHELRSIEVLAGQRCEARAKTSPLGEQPVKLVPKAIELACCVFKLEGLLIEKACEHEALVGRVREHAHEEDIALVEDGKKLAGALALLRVCRPLPHYDLHGADEGVQIQNAAAQGLRGRVKALLGEAHVLHSAPDVSGVARPRLLSNFPLKNCLERQRVLEQARDRGLAVEQDLQDLVQDGVCLESTFGDAA